MGIFAYFVLNNEYVAKVLCENKNRPELHCNGQCYLAKKLKAAEQQERQNMANLLKTQKIEVFYHNNVSVFIPLLTELISEKPAFFYLSGKMVAPTFSIFQPPRLS
jgi:hypothetical protein